MNYTESSGFTTAGNADDERGSQLVLTAFSGSKHKNYRHVVRGKNVQNYKKRIIRKWSMGFGRVIAKSLWYFDLDVK